MSILSWNCRGLGNPATVRVLVDLIHSKKPEIVFLIETIVGYNKLEPIRARLGFKVLFVVDNMGHSGGLALMWKEGTEVDIVGYSRHHIDAIVCLEGGRDKWRLTGYYGQPDRSRRRESWQLLKALAPLNTFPWAILGDFNDILNPKEKRGGNPQPRWLIQGFKEAVEFCGLRDLGLQGHQFTWERLRGTPAWIEEKLDCVLVTDSRLELFENAKAISVVASQSDHLPILFCPAISAARHVKRKFKFENAWLKENQCREIVIQSWASTYGHHLLERVERCGKAMWQWGKELSKGFKPKIEFWKYRMERSRNRRDRFGIVMFSEAQKQYLKALEQENSFWKQRSKVFWLKEGDTNSRFFHNAVRRRKRNNRIFRLRDKEGKRVERGEKHNSHMLNFYMDLFKSNQGDMAPVLECVQEGITQAQSLSLTRRVNKHEVQKALFEMHPDKSPGTDGMSPGFYQNYWDILGNDVVLFCDQFVQSGVLPKGINQTHIVLIPKKSKPETMGDLRPIALCNVLYKIIAKVLANRIKPLLSNLVSETQGAFVPGRSISDNIMIAYEIQHYLKRKSQGKVGYTALKLDMSRAYDRVEWKLLMAILERMGFSRDWNALIWECISTVEYKILSEGDELGPITPQRGLRQGDPLSPYLFILVLEGLTAMIKRQENRGIIHGVSIARNAPAVTQLILQMIVFFFAGQIP